MFQKNNVNKYNARFWLVLILIFAVILRLIFFVGYTASPAHENIHLSTIKTIYKGKFHDYLLRYRNMPSDYVASSAETHPIRLMMNYPVAFFWFLMGVNDLTTVLWPLIASLGIVISTFYIGKTLYDEKTGLLASFLVSFFPVDVINSTRLDTDIILAFFMALGVLFFLKGIDSKTNKKVYYFLMGISLGLGYLIKPFIILLPLIFSFYILYLRRIDRDILMGMLGFLIIFTLECLFFYLTTDHFLLHFKITATAIKSYTLRTLSGSFYLFDNFRVLYCYRPPLYFLPYMFISSKIPSDVYPQDIRLFAYLLVFSVIILSVKNKFKKIFFPMIWFLVLLMYLEFGPISINFNQQLSTVDYLLVPKETRYISIFSSSISLILAYFLTFIHSRLRSLKIGSIITVLIILLLLTFSVDTISKSRDIITDGISDIRDAHALISKLPAADIYCDRDCIFLLDYYFEFKREASLRDIERVNVNDIERGSYVIVGGSRSVVIGGKWLDSRYPDFTKNPPENWKLIKKFDKEKQIWRDTDMAIYHVE